MIIDKNKIKLNYIKSSEELQEIINNSNPDKDNNTGFWLFKESLDKDFHTYAETINKAPWYIQYICYYYNNKPIALMAFSLKYYSTYQKISKYKKFVKIIDFQVDSNYAGNNIQNWAYENFSKLLKSKGFKGLAQVAYGNKQYQKYLKDGFLLDNDYNVMVKPFTKEKVNEEKENMINELLYEFKNKGY